MSVALSEDLRSRIVDAYLAGEGSYEELAERFDVARSSVYRLLKRFHRTGSVSPSAHGGGQPAKIAPDDAEVLAALVRAMPDASVQELATAWSKRHGQLSRSAMLRALHRFALSFKKSRSARASKTVRRFKPSARSFAPR